MHDYYALKKAQHVIETKKQEQKRAKEVAISELPVSRVDSGSDEDVMSKRTKQIVS